MDFSFQPDNEAYQNARYMAETYNTQCEDTAQTYEYILEAIANGDKELEAKLNPSNEYSI